MRSASTSQCSRQSRKPRGRRPDATAAARSIGRHSACQAPAARSCSCAMQASSVATRPGAGRRRRAPDRRDRIALVRHASTIRRGRRRPRAPRRPRSGRAARRRRRSCRPPRRPRRARPPGRRCGVRSVCHGQRRFGAGRARRRSGRATAGPPVAERGQRSRSPAELHGEPRRAGPRRAAPPTSSSPAIQPAAFSPNVVGSACWSSVRADHERLPMRAGELRAPRPTPPSRSSSSGSSARRATSIAAVSNMSWLVAPRWTWRAASPGDRGRQRLDERDHRIPAVRRRGPDRGDVEVLGPARAPDGLGVARTRSRRRALRRGRAPPRRPASPASHARSLTSARTRPRARTSSKRPVAADSDIEEDGLTFALQADVETVAVAGPRRQQRGRRRSDRSRCASTGSSALDASRPRSRSASRGA